MKTVMWFGFVLGALSAAGKVNIIKPRQKITLECGVNSDSRSLEWHRENVLIFNIDGRTGRPRKGPGEIVKRSRVIDATKLQISGVKEEDAGKFSCVADGRREEHTLLVVSVSASPSSELQLGSEATLQCQVKGLIPSDSTTVQWKRSDGSLKPKTVQIKSVASSDAGTWECTFSHDGVLYSESLEVKVKEPAPETASPVTIRSDDSSGKPPCLKCVTHHPSDAPLLLGLTWWMWVAVGVGCLIVVLLMLFVIVLTKRIRRRKRKIQMMKNGRRPLRPKTYCQCARPTAAAKPQQGRRREKPSAPPLQPLLME